MPEYTTSNSRGPSRRAFLSHDLIAQLKDLFDKAPNVHRRLGLHEIVQLSDVQKGLAGYPVPEHVERVLVARWAEWRAEFLARPEDCLIEREKTARKAGEYRHPDCRDALSERVITDFGRFTLPPDARKHL